VRDNFVGDTFPSWRGSVAHGLRCDFFGVLIGMV
jgi:hypothetical protein